MSINEMDRVSTFGRLPEESRIKYILRSTSMRIAKIFTALGLGA